MAGLGRLSMGANRGQGFPLELEGSGTGEADLSDKVGGNAGTALAERRIGEVILLRRPGENALLEDACISRGPSSAHTGAGPVSGVGGDSVPHLLGSSENPLGRMMSVPGAKC